MTPDTSKFDSNTDEVVEMELLLLLSSQGTVEFYSYIIYVLRLTTKFGNPKSST